MKKAQYDLSRKALYYILVVLVIAAMFIYLTNAFDKYRRKSVEQIDDLIDLVAVTKAMYCLSYKDDNGKIHTGFLDDNKFTKEGLLNCLQKDEILKEAALKVTLEGKQTIKTIEDDEQTKYRTFYKYVLSEKETKKLTIEVARFEKEE